LNRVVPAREEFKELAKNGRVSPVFLEIPYRRPALCYGLLRQHIGGALTPGGAPASFLLESIKGPFNIARYSYIGFDPYIEVKAKKPYIEVSASFGRGLSTRKPLSRLRELVSAYPQSPQPDIPPFQGGAVGLLSYDFVRYLEAIPSLALDDLDIPEAHFFMCDKLVSFDHKEGRAWVVCCPGARESRLGFNAIDVDWGVEYDKAAGTLQDIAMFLSDSDASTRDPVLPGDIAPSGCVAPPECEIVHGITKSDYMDMVERALGYIRAGDIFQANLSQRLSADIGHRDPFDIYLKLSEINPSPFACYMDFGGYVIAGSSPERLVRLKPSPDGRRVVETRPIAGTRPRGDSIDRDAAMRAELLLNEKERAEHIMLIDLERNDMGRVCNYGSVSVDELMITEDYSHVMHIVSNVRGILNPRMDAFDVLKAVFPGGTITGVPKVRCMEIIDELEPVLRGPYTGSIGYVGFGGDMDFNIVIRSFVIKDRTAYVQAGAGIVADSDPEREYFETLKKAEALLKTLKMV
jgi:anthranilate/para-aminobenzoate synthase component I